MWNRGRRESGDIRRENKGSQLPLHTLALKAPCSLTAVQPLTAYKASSHQCRSSSNKDKDRNRNRQTHSNLDVISTSESKGQC